MGESGSFGVKSSCKDVLCTYISNRHINRMKSFIFSTIDNLYYIGSFEIKLPIFIECRTIVGKFNSNQKLSQQ